MESLSCLRYLLSCRTPAALAPNYLGSHSWSRPFRSVCAEAGLLLLYGSAACSCCSLWCRMPAASAAHCLGANHGAGRLEASQQQRGCQAQVLMGWGRQLPRLRGLQRRRRRREARHLGLWGSLGSSQEGGGAGVVGQSALRRSRARPSTAHPSRGPLQVRQGDIEIKHHMPHASSLYFSRFWLSLEDAFKLS